MNIDISFIIPVYNNAEYISECITSLQNINMQNIEFVFINDGSTDKTKEILEKYALNDSRISIYNQKNEGVSAARNNGLEKAKGKWITFIDGDDVISSEVYEAFIKKITDKMDLYILACTEGNIPMSNFGKFNNNSEILSKLEIQSIQSKLIQPDNALILEYKKKGIFWNFACTCFYKNTIIKKNNIKFNTHMVIGEDLLFKYIYLNHIENIFINYSVGYWYRINTLSTMHAYKENKADSILKNLEQLLCELPEEKEHIYQFGIKQYLYALQLDFCNRNNPKKYYIRRKEAISMRRSRVIKICFKKGNIMKLRKAAILLAIPAKLELFSLCNAMLKIKDTFKIRF